MTALARSSALVLALAGALAGPALAQPHTHGLTPYRAVYEIFEGDKHVGQSVFTLSYDPASGQYTFESQSRFLGWLRLVAPRPVIERSTFFVADGMIQPTAFVYEDGTRRGRRNLSSSFDWQARTLAIQRREAPMEIPLEPETLDRGSVRVALMLDLARGNSAGTHLLADPDVIRAYDYVTENTEELETALGDVTAHRIRQQRDGSARHTLMWMAPSLDFVTLRLEQRREDRDPLVFVIESLEWLGDDNSSNEND